MNATRPATDAVQIGVEHVSKQFEHRVKGRLYAVRDLSLTVAPGELLTLLGPSGCGKTTTLRMIAGFEEPDEGTIRIGARDVTHVMANARNIGFVFQNYALFPHLSVFENVAYGLRVQSAAEIEVSRRVGEVLGLVGLAGYDQQHPHQLSGGEQQRVALARAIVFQPRVLLFDEPLSNLDAKLRVQMRGEIQQLQKRLGITTVYVTHDQEEAMAISDRIAIMDKGVIVQQGSAEALYHRPVNEFVAQFIGRTNLLTARLLALAGGRAELEIAGQRFVLGTTRTDLPAGGVVRVVVRPEALTLHAPGAAGALAGTVVGRTFLGEKTEYLVEAAGQTLQVTDYRAGPDRGWAAGDAVGVALPNEGPQLLPVTS
jgi:iron(III) transport system ATP-binding protein